MPNDGWAFTKHWIVRTLALAAATAAIGGCASSNNQLAYAPVRTHASTKTASYVFARHRTLRRIKVRKFRTAHAAPRSFEGYASYYTESTEVASGGPYRPNELTAAHRSLPFGTRVRVRDVKTGRSVVVVINDRGPFIRGRVLDLSLGAAKALGMEISGVNRIHADVMLSGLHDFGARGRAEIEGHDSDVGMP